MIFDFIKSRFETKNEPLVARLAFKTTNKSPEVSSANPDDKDSKNIIDKTTQKVDNLRKHIIPKVTVKNNPSETKAGKANEKTKKSLIENDYSEDIQKWLYTKTELNKRLPSKWFQVDSEPGKEIPKEKIQAQIEETYNELFGKGSEPLQEQLAEYNAKYRTGKDKNDKAHPQATVEELVFGSKATSGTEKKARLREVRNRLENISKIKETNEVKEKSIMKNLGDGVSNIAESFQENLSEGKWVEAGLQAVGMYILIQSAWTLLKKKPGDEGFASSLITNVLKASVGVAILMPSATHGKHDLLNMAKLTKYGDKMRGGGLDKLMEGLDYRTRTEGEAIKGLVDVDIGDIQKSYDEARGKGESEIDPRKLLGKKAPRKSILDGKELFNVVEAILTRYGNKYFEAVMGRPPTDRQEIQDGISLFVRYHKQTESQSKSFASIVADEEMSFENWQLDQLPEGKIAILMNIAKDSLSMLNLRNLGEKIENVIHGWVDLIGGDREWFNENVTQKVKDEIIWIYSKDKELGTAAVIAIKKFAKGEYKKWDDKGAEVYITKVTEKAVMTTIELAGATIKGVYEIGAGTLGVMTNVTINVGGHIYKDVEKHINTKGSFGDITVHTPWIPCKVNKDGTYELLSTADVLDPQEAKKWWKNFYDVTLPAQWKQNVKPHLDGFKKEVVEDYDLFKQFVKELIDKDYQLKPGQTPTSGKDINEFFTDKERLFQQFLRTAEVVSKETLDSFKVGDIGLVDFLKQSLEEREHQTENIKQFNDVISSPAKEKEYFGVSVLGGKTSQEKLEGLEPGVRAWTFDQIGSWGWDLDMSADKANFNPQEGYIKYNEITLESIGMLGKLPFLGNEKCKLRINFAGNGDLEGKKRFELTTQKGARLELNPGEIKEIAKQFQKTEASFDEMSKLTMSALDQKIILTEGLKNEQDKEKIKAEVRKMSMSPEMQKVFLPLIPLMENAEEDFDFIGSIKAPFEALLKGGTGPVNENQWAALVTYKQHEMLLFYQNMLVAGAKEETLNQDKIAEIGSKFKEKYLKPITKSSWLGLADSQIDDITDQTEGVKSWICDASSKDYRAALSGLLSLGSRNEFYPDTLKSLVSKVEQVNFSGRNLGKYANDLKSVALWKFAEMAAPLATLEGEENFIKAFLLPGNAITQNHKEYLNYLSGALASQLDYFAENGRIIKSVNASEVAQIFRKQLKVQTFEEFTGQEAPEEKGRSWQSTIQELAGETANTIKNTAKSAQSGAEAAGTIVKKMTKPKKSKFMDEALGRPRGDA